MTASLISTHKISSPTERDRYATAIDEWECLLGHKGVRTHADGLEKFTASTSAVNREIPAVLHPTSSDQIESVLEIARRNGVALYPISTGNNWGYGSSNPVKSGSVILDLSKLNRILHCDEELGTVTVEPGVTQQQLYDFLQRRELPYLVPVHGGGPDCSLLGNLLERGYGITPYTDHFAAVTSLEAILADGRIYRSPLGDMNAGAADRVFKWGIGPYLDGLFSQSNLGIVLNATITLAPRPAHTEAFLFKAKSEEHLEGLVVVIRDLLRRLGSNLTSINLMNALRVLSMTVPYPNAGKDGSSCLSQEHIAELCHDNGVAPWTGAGAILGDSNVVKTVKKIVKRHIKPLCSQFVFINRRTLARYHQVARVLPNQWREKTQLQLDAAGNLIDIVEGRPCRVALPLAYWKSGQKIDTTSAVNPAHDQCGLRWYAPLVTMRPRTVREYVQMVERTCQEFQIDPLITLTSLSERCFDSTVPVLFDRSSTEDVKRANVCFNQLLENGKSKGYVPYRVGVDHMDWAIDTDQTSWQMVEQIKRTLDSQHILSPGRYCPTAF